MPKIQLFEVDDYYIQYLQQFDNRVLNHYGANYVKSRKYLGILININDCDYIAPLSSPSKTDYKDGVIRKSVIPLVRIVKLKSEKMTLLFNTPSITAFICSVFSDLTIGVFILPINNVKYSLDNLSIVSFLKIAFLNSHLIVNVLSISKISIVISNGDVLDFIGICFKKPSSSVFTLLNAKNTSNNGFLV